MLHIRFCVRQSNCLVQPQQGNGCAERRICGKGFTASGFKHQPVGEPCVDAGFSGSKEHRERDANDSPTRIHAGVRAGAGAFLSIAVRRCTFACEVARRTRRRPGRVEPRRHRLAPNSAIVIPLD